MSIRMRVQTDELQRLKKLFKKINPELPVELTRRMGQV